MQVQKVPAIDVVITVECAGEAGAAVAVLRHHGLVLCQRVPAHVVAQVDAAHAHCMQRSVVGVAVLPDVFFFQGVEGAQQLVCFQAHQVVVLAVAAAHLRRLLVSKHAHLFQALVRAPDDERHLVAHGSLHRKHALPRQAMPVQAAQFAQRGAGELLHRPRVDVLHQDVAVHLDAQVGEVADAQGRVEVLVVADQQRVQPQLLLHQVHDPVRIVGAADRHDAVVVVAAFAAIRCNQRLKLAPACGPVQAVFLFVDAAARADAFLIQHQAQRVVGGVEAAGAVQARIAAAWVGGDVAKHAVRSRPARRRWVGAAAGPATGS